MVWRSLAGTKPMLSNPAIIARALLVGAALAGLGAVAGPVRAQGAEVALFKVVTVKDEIVVGLSPAELASIGGDASAIARRLIGKGEMTMTRFAVRKNAAGDLEFGPSADVAILAHASVRIEPYAPSLKVVASR